MWKLTFPPPPIPNTTTIRILILFLRHTPKRQRNKDLGSRSNSWKVLTVRRLALQGAEGWGAKQRWASLHSASPLPSPVPPPAPLPGGSSSPRRAHQRLPQSVCPSLRTVQGALSAAIPTLFQLCSGKRMAAAPRPSNQGPGSSCSEESGQPKRKQLEGPISGFPNKTTGRSPVEMSTEDTRCLRSNRCLPALCWEWTRITTEEWRITNEEISTCAWCFSKNRPGITQPGRKGD